MRRRLDIRAIAKSGGLDLRRLIQFLLNASRPWVYAKRRYLKKGLSRQNEGGKILESVTKMTRYGYCRIGWMPKKLCIEVQDAAEAVITQIDLGSLEKNSKFPHLISIEVNDFLTRDHPFFQMATCPELVSFLRSYFKLIPVLQSLRIAYSPNRHEVSNSSQKMHLDWQSLRTVHLYFFLSDVSLDSGPLTIVDAENSLEVARRHHYSKNGENKRLEDCVFPNHTVKPLIGPAGTVYAADVDRCFHFGSRAGSKPRFVLIATYLSPLSYGLPRNWRTKLPLCKISDQQFGTLTEIESLVVGR